MPSTALARFGVQLPLQHVDVDEVRAQVRAVDACGYGWISVWDHLHAVNPDPADPHGGLANLDAIAMLAVLALDSSRARIGCLVHPVTLRHPAVLASALATIDRLSGGRLTAGLGTGYLASEHEQHAIPLGTPGERVERLGEHVLALRALLDGAGPVDLDGRFVTLRGAVCQPPPSQHRVPIWVGGGGERATIPLAARLADGWNVPMCTVDDLRRKVAVLHRTAEAAGRDPATIEVSVNLGICADPAEGERRFGDRWTGMRGATLTGGTQEMIDRVAAYRAVGVDRIILTLRPTTALDEVLRFAAEIAPAVP